MLALDWSRDTAGLSDSRPHDVFGGNSLPSFVEFFAGGGFVRLGLGDGWTCVRANDVSPKKAATYRANFGVGELLLRDVRALGTGDIPAADLWWASFPCQDHSSSGPRVGFEGSRGSLVFEIMRLLDAASASGQAPKLLAFENVVGFVRSADGDDFVSLMTALASAGYRIGALIMDARAFLPQSRPRMIIVAVRHDAAVPKGLVSPKPLAHWHNAALVKAVGRLPATVAKRWTWWRIPLPPAHRLQLSDLLDPAGGEEQKWLPSRKVAEMLAQVADRDAVRLEASRRVGHPVAATTVGTRKDSAGGSRRIRTIRTDGVAGCLLCRTKSNRQQLAIIEANEVRIRSFTRAELGRLMGLPEGYLLPVGEPDTVRLTGDGVVVPVVRWLSANLLEPLLVAASDEAMRPRTAPKTARALPVRRRKDPALHVAGGLKRATVGTTAYFLPEESKRVQGAAAGMGVSLHEFIILALDGQLARLGMQPVRRYAKPTARWSKPNAW